MTDEPMTATGAESGAESGAAASRPPASLMRHPDFLRLWTAETISQVGTQVSQLAIPFAALLILKASTFEVALLNVVEMLPFLLVGLVAGVWVDRLRRRPILVVGDLGRAALLATIPIAYALGILTMLQLYVVGAAVGVLTVFFDIAYQSYLPSLVSRDQLQEGNSKLEISRASAQTVGPGLAGIIIGIVTAPIAVALDALSFVGSGLFIFSISSHEPAPERHPSNGGRGPGMRTEMAEGLRYVLGHRYLRNIAACTGTSNLFSSLAFSILIVFAVRTLGMTAEGIGLAFSIGSLGALAGAFLANRISTRIGVGRTIVLFASIGGPPSVLFALAPAGTAQPVVMALLALSTFVNSLGAVVYNVAQVSLRQAITETRLQGRMNATMRWIVWGTMPIGGLLGGVLGTVVGVRETVLLGFIGMSVAFLPVLFSQVRSIGAMPAPVEEEPAGTPRG